MEDPEMSALGVRNLRALESDGLEFLTSGVVDPDDAPEPMSPDTPEELAPDNAPERVNPRHEEKRAPA